MLCRSHLGAFHAYILTRSLVRYAVLYAYTPEVFATKDRGTGNALAATSNRIFGIMAVSKILVDLKPSTCRSTLEQSDVLTLNVQPVIAIYGDLTTSVPVYVSGALFIVAGLIVVILPFESQGKASL